MKPTFTKSWALEMSGVVVLITGVVLGFAFGLQPVGAIVTGSSSAFFIAGIAMTIATSRRLRRERADKNAQAELEQAAPQELSNSASINFIGHGLTMAVTPAPPQPTWEPQIGSLFGYRRFKVDSWNRIRPWADIPYIWTPGENVAKCLKTAMYSTYSLSFSSSSVPRSAPHRAPHHECDCGFYARFVYDDDVIEETWNLPTGVLGVIEAYGRAEVGTKGFRAEKAKIVALWLPGRKQHLAERLPELYPDVAIYKTKAELFDAHPEFGMTERTDVLPAHFWSNR